MDVKSKIDNFIHPRIKDAIDKLSLNEVEYFIDHMVRANARALVEWQEIKKTK